MNANDPVELACASPRLATEEDRRLFYEDPSQTTKFLAWLRRGGRFAYYWTVTGEGKDTFWYPAGKDCSAPKGEHVYFGVHPTNGIPQRTNKKTGRVIPQKWVRAYNEDIAAINCLFAEFDAKDFEGRKQAALNHIDSFYGRGFPPHIIIDSGGGYHVYWLLANPVTITTPAQRAQICKIQAEWVGLTGGDPGAKDLARVLRLPGSLNHKYNPPRPVKFVMWDAGLQPYELGDLEKFIPAMGIGQQVQGNNGRYPNPGLGAAILRRALGLTGNRNNDCFWLAQQANDNLLPLSDIRLLVMDYQAAVENQKPGEAPFTVKEAERTLDSALSIPPRQPWTRSEKITIAAPPMVEAQQAENLAQPTEQAENDRPLRPTDDEIASRWMERYPLSAYGLGDWRRYEGGIWKVIKDYQVGREVLDILQAAKVEGVRPTKNLITSVIEIAKINMAVDDEAWDANHDVIICKNGAYHIPSGRLLPHSPDHLATERLEFDYDPAATAPTWLYVLASTIPEATDFLQEYAGLCLTTDTSFELALWFTGPAGSGKSTVIEGLQAALGERAILLGLADIERSRFALGNLRGKTLAVASEQPALYMQATHILNAIVSGEKIHTERKFQDPIEFTPRVKVVWAMNELPRIPDAGNGLFRRVKVVRFPLLSAEKRDPQIKERVKQEGAGILNWAVAGLQRLRARGSFAIPPCVIDATDDFQRNNDIPAVFVAEKCVSGAEYKTQAGQLYEAYKVWCESNGHKPMSSTSLAGEWSRLGFTKYTVNGRNFWRGVGLQVDTMPEK